MHYKELRYVKRYRLGKAFAITCLEMHRRRKLLITGRTELLGVILLGGGEGGIYSSIPTQNIWARPPSRCCEMY